MNQRRIYHLNLSEWRAKGMQCRRWGAVALAGLLTLAAASTATAALRDLSGHWANSLVSLLEAKGLVSGDEAARFLPEAPLTRAQLAKLLVGGLGHDGDAAQLRNTPSRFADLPSWHWAVGWVESLAELRLTDGFPDGTFHPDEPVTRAQLAVLLVRAAGLEELAAAQADRATAYLDDAEIPRWARGAINAATATGLLQGAGDGLFRPLAPLTRAEGSAVLYRLVAQQGRLYHLSGTLVAWDPATRQGKVRDALGVERPFELAPNAPLFQAGQPTSVAGVRRLDQVWIALGPDGKGSFLEARYQDLTGRQATVVGRKLSLLTKEGKPVTLTVQEGALVYVNGKPSSLAEVNGALFVYTALDWLTGDVRAVDAVKPTETGTFIDPVGEGPEFYATVNDEPKLYRLAEGVRPYLLGAGRATLSDLPAGARLYLVADQAGLVSYLFVER
jgi:hypothetical protein